nr:T-cell surface glycoprotein CD3 gamma chain [Taeniopygia guttata]
MGTCGCWVRRQALSPSSSSGREEGSAPGIRYQMQPGRAVPCGEQHVLERGQSHQRRAMAGGKALSAWALLASLAMATLGVRGQIYVKEFSGKVFLECVRDQGSKNITWWRDGSTVGHEAQLDLNRVYDDPRGLYVCETGSKRSSLQVHYRMCQNCIEVDAPTVSGIVIADVVATLFLAVAVYCITGHNRGHTSRASDRQNLIANELYQPLGERDDEQYSRLAPARARK